MKKLIPVLVFLLPVPQAGLKAQTPEPAPYRGSGPFSGLKGKYLPRYSPPVEFANSNRMEKLMRASRIYLSIDDAIALALENNLDIEFARFYPKSAESDIMRAKAGQLLRGMGSSGVRSGPSSASGALAGVSGVSSGSVSGGASSGILSGVSVQLAGTSIPNLDPTVFFNAQAGHATQPLTNSFATGTNYLVSNYKGSSYGIRKGFLTGTSVTLDMSSQNLTQNSPRNDFNPTTSGNVGFTVNQRLLQGFGLALNSRMIKVSKNNRRVADLNFKGQVIATVANVVDLYYDLVAFNEVLKVRQQALELNEKLYSDNKRRAELGAIAPIDIVQAEAEVAASQQEVTNAETQVLQQEMILKNVLTRGGVDNVMLAEARIVPTSRIDVPEREPIEPIQDLIAQALAARPEIERSAIDMENSRLSLMGTKNAMLPSLDVFGSFQNSGLAGQMNSLVVSGAEGQAMLAQRAASLNPFFLGGYGSFFSQLLRRNFPDYAVGFSLNIPLTNRAAQADLVQDQIRYRQQQINDKQTQNNIRLNVVNARTAVAQARAAYETSVKARVLQEQILSAERRKFQLGTSSFLNVVIVQRDAVARQANEVQALSAYRRARANLDVVLGRILEQHNVSMDEALAGVVKREPDLPVDR